MVLQTVGNLGRPINNRPQVNNLPYIYFIICSAAIFFATSSASSAGTLTSGSTPVPSQLVFRNGVYCLREWHADHEVIVDSMAGNRMRTASRGLPDDRRALQVLEVVAELE